MDRRNFLKGLGAGITARAATSLAITAGSLPVLASAGERKDAGNRAGIRTGVLVRPAARGGKYLGHDAANAANHSALIALQDPRSGRIVAHALASAPTAESAGPGDLMAPVSRSMPFASDGQTVDVLLHARISEPTDFRLLVFGPLKHPGQARLVQTDITLLPGVDIGLSPQHPQGLVIEIAGLCISDVVADWQSAQLSCTAMVTMMCGCPIRNEANWFWPDSDFTIQLVTRMQSGATHIYPLAFDPAPGLVSTFSGSWPTQAARGDRVVQAWVYASEAKLGNQGKYRVHPRAETLPPLPPEVRALLGKVLA
ncbi:hypothetical protein [Chitinilyticum litopenaei]|uniref:hypothetical protein n=1 Tax=Chitinilyticum litopenaei TaxID=1121276 RepID=UPI00042587CC|nr:hypothetical protein [Chitinilyticum litopenaei]